MTTKGLLGGRQRPVQGPLERPQGPLERPLTAPCGLLRGRSTPPFFSLTALRREPQLNYSCKRSLRQPQQRLSQGVRDRFKAVEPIFEHRNDSPQHEDACFSPL